MNILRPMVTIALGIVLFSGCLLSDVDPGISNPGSSLPDRHPLDKSEYRRFTLDNGLKVIIVADPKFNLSAAAMSVAVGSLSDPENRSGLAHFLEHMLFLGTEKYPDVGDYSAYLRSNGGYSNAYTSGDHTNYHFEVRHEVFEGALDRFSQFFLAPLFTPEFTEREMNAVNSEHQKNLENDRWRSLQIRRSHYNPGHPANHFSTGNLETLRGVTRDHLLRFYDQHYSANRMTLALAGKTSLDEMDAWVRRYFSQVPNRDLSRNAFPTEYLTPRPVLRVLRIEPIKDIRQLQIEFPLPPFRSYFESKPDHLLGFILGYEGEGSLLSLLKKEGLATSLGAGVGEDTEDFGSFFISIELTPKGGEYYETILSLTMSFIRELQESGYPSHLFEERAVMARLDELYSDRGEGAARARFLSNQLQSYPLEIAEREPYLYLRQDENAYALLLRHLRPDNMLVILTAKGVYTDQTEPIYGTAYSYSEDSGRAYQSLLNPRHNNALFLPKANPFIPSEIDVLSERPVQLLDEDGLSLYYSQDLEFRRPKGTLSFRVRQSREAATLKEAVLKDLYQACVNEAINEVAYTAAVAGVTCGFSADLKGVSVMVSGYNESALKLFQSIVAAMQEIRLSEDRFEDIKERMIRDLENFHKHAAWRIARTVKRKIVREVSFRPEERLPVAREITFAEVAAYPSRLYRSGHIEGLVHGNLSVSQALRAARLIADALKLKPVARSGLYNAKLLVQDRPESILAVEHLQVNNSCFWREYFLGPDNPEVRAAASLLQKFMSEPFFTEMRTRQQLGYIVFSGTGRDEDQQFGYFIIQSDGFAPDELESRADDFIGGFPEAFSALEAETFEELRAAARAELEKKPTSIAEKARLLFARTFELELDWERIEETLSALDQLTHESVASLLKEMISPETRRMRTVLLVARDHNPSRTLQPTFSNLITWKQSRRFE